MYALLKEWDARHNELTDPITTVYLGGGTPSLLSPAMLSAITSVFATPDVKEFTIEANPEDITEQWAEHIIGSGINRVSLGIQSLIDRELSAVGRRHTAAEAVKAIETLRKTGITEISGDLIYGLPEQTVDTWRYSLDTLAALGLPHISAYSLSYEEGTRLHARLLAGKLQETDEDTVAAMYEYMTRTLDSAGYEHYEISNFCRPSMYSRHNMSYWKGIPYLGCGPSAHSFNTDTREWNIASLEEYIAAVESGGRRFEKEYLDRTTRYNECVMTSIRTQWGVPLHDVERKFGKELWQYCMDMARPHLHNGQLEIRDNHLCLTRKGIFVSDGIMSDLMFVEE